MAIVDIILPKLGESVAEATILKWLKKIGDPIQMDENLAEVATDKVDTDLPSEYKGVLHSILVKEGEVAQVGATIATIEVAGDATIKIEKDEHRSEKTSDFGNQEQLIKSAKSVNQVVKGNRILQNATSLFLTPVVRNIAAEAGLTADELLRIKPTGSNSTRITKKDILNYLHPPVQKPLAAHDAKRKLAIEPEDQVVPLSRMRKLIADHMSTSVQTAAHVTSWSEVDVTEIVTWRQAHKEDFIEEHGVKLTYTHLFMQEIVETLKAFPKLNAWLNGGEELIIKNKINLGFATATPNDNLIVPNLKDASALGLVGIVKGVNELGSAAKNGKLKPRDIEETTFTISNTGAYGSLMGTPILSLPQVGILALGEIVSKPSVIMVDGDEIIAIRKLMYLSLSYDHRIIDGAYGSN
ncbi:MAG: 2-oxoglutarate dehydrogenase E2 component (dihydrolipoamide succinyltransferase), partial [Saprospiraceae bacterium]